ncbi:MAG: hypothetical protein OXI43_15055 [Candidatus Poribacteria bacterium]|nr:hypothetical protein [Candidatus Poribacteria bacterium]
MIGNFEGLAILAILWAVFTAIFWMVVGWRAMRAHEKLADSVEWLARQNSRQEPQSGSLGDD